MYKSRLSDVILKICEQMENFEAPGSIAKTGTGSRREGEDFENLIAKLWLEFRDTAQLSGANIEIVKTSGSRFYAKLTVGKRSVFIPTLEDNNITHYLDVENSQWLDIAFSVSGLVEKYPTEDEAIRRYAPETGPYANKSYPSIYKGMKTKFDDTVVLLDNGILREKILLEYKTAKSTAKHQIDGNAHERLSFQMMQYLEVATRYTKCSLVVIANGAFVRYRNKYHVNFHIQADRLRNFSWFSMEYACTKAAYIRFLEGLLNWLFEGKPRCKRNTND